MDLRTYPALLPLPHPRAASLCLLLCLGAVAWPIAQAAQDSQGSAAANQGTAPRTHHKHVSTTDHKAFDQLNRPFKSGQEVTRACLSCHVKASWQIHQTTHWRWNFTHPKSGQTLGKRNLVNNFCGAISTNYALCSTCHISYGWTDANFDFTSEENVDCLVCHDGTGTYKKFPIGASHPNFKDYPPDCGKCHNDGDPNAALAKLPATPFMVPGADGGTPVICDGCHGVYPHGDNELLDKHAGKVYCQQCHSPEPDPASPMGWKGVDLTNIARNVGPPTRRACGNCHFNGGGGNAVKHGDLDYSLAQPKKSLDVHMDAEGLDFSCSTCHRTNGHQVSGSRYAGLAKDTEGIVVPGRDDDHTSCESCHGDTPHPRSLNNKINDHTDKVACQTCHIPSFARGGFPTLVGWDWSTSGRLDDKGRPLVQRKDANTLYYGKKGDLRYAQNVTPEYHWYNGDTRYTLIQDKLDPRQPVWINRFTGSYDDPRARIWPFKSMHGRQPYDKGNNTLVVVHLIGNDDSAYWKHFDWDKAISAGMRAVGAPYSGQYGFVDNVMYWPITHMVAPKEQALVCDDCHSKNGRLKDLPGFYMPGRDANLWLELIGWTAVLSAIGGVLVHIVWHARSLRTHGRGRT